MSQTNLNHLTQATGPGGQLPKSKLLQQIQSDRTGDEYQQQLAPKDNYPTNHQTAQLTTALKNPQGYTLISQSSFFPTKNQNYRLSSQAIGEHQNKGKPTFGGNTQVQDKSQNDKKVVYITSTSKAARDYIAKNFTRDQYGTSQNFDIFTVPGGIFGLKKHLFLEECLSKFIQIMSMNYQISDIYLISFLNENTNVQANLDDYQKKELQKNIMNFLKILLEVRLNFKGKMHGIIVYPDQRKEVVF
ncbi:unnamed protein product [Paramecium octaurelia]|uniref:Uncharacterized protein n=1 Tax=Paramecium octaurelia TaxID=43137 RepID=A0A8S1XGN9_PAROT|nr:unnamed protein product [Paramecium octaurelia]